MWPCGGKVAPLIISKQVRHFIADLLVIFQKSVGVDLLQQQAKSAASANLLSAVKMKNLIV